MGVKEFWPGGGWGVKKWKMLFKKTFENIKRVGVHHASPHFLVGNIIANHGFESASFLSMMKERIDELVTEDGYRRGSNYKQSKP